MPCITQPNRTPVQIKRQDEAIKRLEALLASGAVTATVGATGSVAFKGWAEQDKGGVSDLCAYRKLAASNSPALRRAVMRAEAMAGRKVDPRAINAGTHSHDGGQSWHPGH